jgi:YHS domain-containing protein
MYRRNFGKIAALAVVMSLLGLLVVNGCEKQKKASVSTKTPATTTTTMKAQATCPIEGAKINKSIYADYQGKRIYFCCADCKAKFNADPAKYVKQMEDKGIALAKVPNQ